MKPSVDPYELLRAVAEEWAVSARKLKRRLRGSPNVAEARDELARRMYEAGYSLSAIGQFLGGRKHSTISVAVQRANERLEKADLTG